MKEIFYSENCIQLRRDILNISRAMETSVGVIATKVGQQTHVLYAAYSDVFRGALAKLQTKGAQAAQSRMKCSASSGKY